jgi:N-acetylglucosaminyl-diphospho-decaprenol L-rhamnosyltransferase
MSDAVRAEPPGADVVIVAHDADGYLRAAAESAEGQAGAGRVVVVDAESSDGSVEALSVSHPGVRVIAAPNRGFSASNNVGIAATSGDYVLLLNPDAELFDGSLARLVAAADADAHIGIVAPRVLDLDGAVQRGSFGAFPTLASTLAMHARRLLERIRGDDGAARRELAAEGPVDWVTGACMLVRRAAIDDVGPMDEGFLLYFEDTDWCHRMHDRGWKVVIEPAASCLHHLGKSGGGPGTASKAYRESFYRYCRVYHLWGLAAAARVGLSVRSLAGRWS